MSKFDCSRSKTENIEIRNFSQSRVEYKNCIFICRTRVRQNDSLNFKIEYSISYAIPAKVMII